MMFLSSKNNSRFRCIGLWILAVAALSCVCLAGQQSYDKETLEKMKEDMFIRVFGGAAKFDMEIVNKVKALPKGQKYYVDNDGDGKNDEVWYIDTAYRHNIKPILVRVFDEDGDLDETGPDMDSDLYFADHFADGSVDVVYDFQDNDGDNDVDEAGWFYWNDRDWFLKKPALKAIRQIDVGDKNLMFHNIN